MPSAKLTKTLIDALAAPAKDTVYWDSNLSGFGLKVTPAGRKVFLVLYRTAGSRLRKYTIGPYGRFTLQQARTAAQRVFAARLDGRDLAAEKQQARRRAVVDRVDLLVEEFIVAHVSGLKSAGNVSRLLRREVIPKWGARSVHEIKRRDVMELVIEASVSAPYRGIKLLKALKRFFSWCLGRAILDASPATGIPSPARARSRDRVLTDAELERVLRSAREMSGPYPAVIEFLALTGQRREEVAQMTWNELDVPNRIWLLPAARSKNGKPHFIHLSDPAVALIEKLPRLGTCVFTVTGAAPFNDFSKWKRRLDELSGVTDWVHHDLRRTCVSGMARLGIAPHVADKILNHQSGTISGVAAVYQRHEFLAERKEALERWGAHVERLMSRPQSTEREAA